jgi:hypothetical protein
VQFHELTNPLEVTASDALMVVSDSRDETHGDESSASAVQTYSSPPRLVRFALEDGRWLAVASTPVQSMDTSELTPDICYLGVRYPVSGVV